MTESQNSYDLEDRTLRFAKDVINLVNSTPGTLANSEVLKQLTRSACSVGANYIEANGALGKKDFVMRIRICRKEAKESRFWLKLITMSDGTLDGKRQTLVQETDELCKIFNAILDKTQ